MTDTNGRYKISALLKQSQGDEQDEQAIADDRPQKQTQQAKQPKKAATDDRPKRKHLSMKVDKSEHLRWQTALLQWETDGRDEMPSTITDLVVAAVNDFIENNA